MVADSIIALMKLTKLSNNFPKTDLLTEVKAPILPSTVGQGDETRISSVEQKLLNQCTKIAFPDAQVISEQLTNIIKSYLPKFIEQQKKYKSHEWLEDINVWDLVTCVHQRGFSYSGTKLGKCIRLYRQKLTTDYNPDLLPLHLNDEKWLVNYVQKIYHDLALRENQQTHISPAKVKQYIKTSQIFIARHDQYKSDVVKCFINNELDEIVKTKNVKYCYWTLSAFRNYISSQMNAFGMEKKTANHLMGVNQEWREKLLHITFYNQVESLSAQEINYLKKNFPGAYESLIAKVDNYFKEYRLKEIRKESVYYRGIQHGNDIMQDLKIPEENLNIKSEMQHHSVFQIIGKEINQYRIMIDLDRRNYVAKEV